MYQVSNSHRSLTESEKYTNEDFTWIVCLFELCITDIPVFHIGPPRLSNPPKYIIQSQYTDL